MTEQDLLKLKNNIDNAQDSVIPFPVVQNDTLAVVGDPNETKINRYDYKITFQIPYMENGTMKTKTQEVEYKNVYITPRQNTKIVRIIAKLEPYLKKINSDGTITDYTNEEAVNIVLNFEDEMYDLMYSLVATVLGVDPSLVDYMVAGSVLQATGQILTNFKDTVNTADTFFD